MGTTIRFDMKHALAVVVASGLTMASIGCGGAPTAVLNYAPAKILQIFPSTYSDLQFYGACDDTASPTPTDRTCREWRGSYFASMTLQVSCQAMPGGVYLTQPCDTTNQIGVCKVFSLNNSNEDVLFFYYSTDWNITTGAADCLAKAVSASGLGSVWVPGS